MAKKRPATDASGNGTVANLGFETKLWLTAANFRYKSEDGNTGMQFYSPRCGGRWQVNPSNRSVSLFVKNKKFAKAYGRRNGDNYGNVSAWNSRLVHGVIA